MSRSYVINEIEAAEVTIRRAEAVLNEANGENENFSKSFRRFGTSGEVDARLLSKESDNFTLRNKQAKDSKKRLSIREKTKLTVESLMRNFIILCLEFADFLYMSMETHFKWLPLLALLYILVPYYNSFGDPFYQGEDYDYDEDAPQPFWDGDEEDYFLRP